MRVAIPTKNNRIDPQYSRAAEFTIYEIEIELECLNPENLK